MQALRLLLEEKSFDAIILAAAGLYRLGLEGQISYRFPAEEMVPAIGQGCLGLELREEDDATRQIVEKLDHSATRSSVLAERVFLTKMGGGCQLPMGAYATTDQHQSRFFAFFSNPSGTKIVKQIFTGAGAELESLVEAAVAEFKSQGSDKLLGEQ